MWRDVADTDTDAPLIGPVGPSAPLDLAEEEFELEPHAVDAHTRSERSETETLAPPHKVPSQLNVLMAEGTPMVMVMIENAKAE